MLRALLLALAKSSRLRRWITSHGATRRMARRFVPGEELAPAIEAARACNKAGMTVSLDHLGENVVTREDAECARVSYTEALDQIAAQGIEGNVSLKLTHLGLDLDNSLCYANLETLIAQSPPGKTVWIDMEQSAYVDRTLAMYTRARRAKANVGVCIQAYLRRTESDLRSLLPLGGAIRLVKGAYNEPAEVAFPKKSKVDENYFQLAKMLLGQDARFEGIRAAIATHDRTLIQRITNFTNANQFPKEKLEFQMLYGIQRAEQQRLAQEGYRSIVLIAYGTHWFPWYMRRLAERPANVLFLLRNLFPS